MTRHSGFTQGNMCRLPADGTWQTVFASLNSSNQRLVITTACDQYYRGGQVATTETGRLFPKGFHRPIIFEWGTSTAMEIIHQNKQRRIREYGLLRKCTDNRTTGGTTYPFSDWTDQPATVQSNGNDMDVYFPRSGNDYNHSCDKHHYDHLQTSGGNVLCRRWQYGNGRGVWLGVLQPTRDYQEEAITTGRWRYGNLVSSLTGLHLNTTYHNQGILQQTAFGNMVREMTSVYNTLCLLFFTSVYRVVFQHFQYKSWLEARLTTRSNGEVWLFSVLLPNIQTFSRPLRAICLSLQAVCYGTGQSQNADLGKPRSWTVRLTKTLLPLAF